LHRWRTECREIDRDAVKRLKDPEKEKSRLKRLVADQQLGIQILKEIAEGDSEPHDSSLDSGAG